jgi:hypothetical protein
VEWLRRMKMSRKRELLIALPLGLGFLAALFVVPLVSVSANEPISIPLAVFYNLDRPSATPYYCLSLGQSGNPRGPNIPGVTTITTVGSSVTVSAVTAGTAPFSGISAKDVLFVTRQATTGVVTDTAVIATVVSTDQVTLTSAVDWSNSGNGYAFSWRKTVCNQDEGSTYGWLTVSDIGDKLFVTQYQQGDLGGGLDTRVECRTGSPGATAVQVYPASPPSWTNLATAGVLINAPVFVPEAWQQCRVGLLAHTSDPTDASTNIERISVSLQGSIYK